VHWNPNNLLPHRQLVRRVAHVMRRAGYPLIFTERMGIDTNSHQCESADTDAGPRRSVLDSHAAPTTSTTCRSATAPVSSSAAPNPALTIAANALRAAAVSDPTR
jgi:hypothetical protein